MGVNQDSLVIMHAVVRDNITVGMQLFSLFNSYKLRCACCSLNHLDVSGWLVQVFLPCS